MTTNIFTINPWLYPNVPFNVERDFAPITLAGSTPNLLATAPVDTDGSDLVLDFTGTDHQVQAALNLPTWNQRGHRQVCFALLNYFRTVDPTIPYNSGLVRPVGVRAPRGTLVNPEPGAAYGVRAATMFRIADIVLACLTQAMPAAVPAAGSRCNRDRARLGVGPDQRDADGRGRPALERRLRWSTRPRRD